MSTKTPSRSSKRVRGESAEEGSAVVAAVVPETASKSKKSKTTPATATVAPVATAAPVVDATASSLASVSSLLSGAVPSDAVSLSTQLRTLQQAVIKASSTDLLHPQLWPALLARLAALDANTARVDLTLLTALGRTVSEIVAVGTAEAFHLLPTLHQILVLLLPSSSTPLTASWSSTFRPSYDFFLAFLGGVVRVVVTSSTNVSAAPADLFRLVSAAFDAHVLITAAQTSQRKAYDAALQERALPMWAMLHQQVSAELRRDARDSDNTETPTERVAALRLCATRIERSIGVLFHAEHLNLYADALGNTNEEEAAAEKDATEEEQAEAEAEAKAAKEKEQKEAEGEEVDAESDAAAAATAITDADAAEQPNKKAKVETKRPTKKATPTVHKPHPANYTRKLFEAVQTWLAKDDAPTETASTTTDAKTATTTKDKKRKHDESTDAAAPTTAATAAATSTPSSAAFFTSRAIRAALPLLFAGYVAASDVAFRALYPTTSPGERGGEHASANLSVGESRRKQLKERVKTAREMQFLQKMWSLNEGTAANAASAASTDAAADAMPAVFTSSLDARTLPLLHDVFATNARLFRLIDAHDLYKIHQDANTALGAAAAASNKHAVGNASTRAANTGFKKLLADQMDKVMRVARTLVQAAAAAGATSTASTAKKSSRKSTKPVEASPVASGISSADLLSLASALTSNALHLLQLNPEFVQRYLYVRGDEDEEDENDKSDSSSINVWHLIWQVKQLSEEATSETVAAASTAGTTDLMSVFSPASESLGSSRALSQALFRSFFKLRQYDVLFHSYVRASRTARRLSARLVLAPFATVNGPKFDLAALMRSIPPLKVPNLWDWFLAQCRQQFGEESASTNQDDAASASLAHFFVYFLDTMLVREEIALQLQERYARSISEVIAPPMRVIRASLTTNVSSAKRFAPASLFLLLHALNEVRAQCDQHTTKTYETMLQPLPTYFHIIENTADDDDAATNGDATLRLTDVVSHLSKAASTDAPLLHALRLVALQRLQQVARFRARNIITNHFADGGATTSAVLEDSDSDSDEEEEVKQKRKASAAAAAAAAAKKTANTQTHLEEAQALTTFLLERLDTCACESAVDEAAHAAFNWDGASASLGRSSSTASSGVALWHLVCAHADVLAEFATADQRATLVERVLAITTCRRCRIAAAINSGENATDKKESSSTMHTLDSLTTALLVQPWVYEVASLRTALMDAILARVVGTASACAKGLRSNKTVQKALNAFTSSNTTTASALRIPVGFTRTTALAAELAELRPLAECLASSEEKSLSASATLDSKQLWETLWLLQVVSALPAQYLQSQPAFHALLVQALFSLETSLGCIAAANDDSKDLEPRALADLAETALDADQAASLRSHLFLACRRMVSSSSCALVQASSHLVGVFAPSFVDWLCFRTFSSTAQAPLALTGRHRPLAQEETRRVLRLVAPILLKTESSATVVVAEKEKKSKKSKDAAAPTESTSPLSGVLARISSVLSSPSSSVASSDLAWCARLASSVVESFVVGWSALLPGSAAADSLARSFRLAARDAPRIFDLVRVWSEAVRGDKLVKRTRKEPALLAGPTFELRASLVVAFFAAHEANAAEKEKEKEKESTLPTMDAAVVADAEEILGSALATLTESSADESNLVARTGALSLVHALCVSLPALPGSPFSALYQALFRVLAGELSSRASNAHVASPVTRVVHAAFLSLQSHATSADCDLVVDHLLQQLDPSFVHAESVPNEEGENTVAGPARMAAALHLLRAYLQHAHSPAQRRAASHPRVALLFYRLASLSGAWHAVVGAQGESAKSGLSLAHLQLQLLGQVLARPQTYALDDQAMALLAHALSHAAAILREEVSAAYAAGGESNDSAAVASASILYQPLYLVLYALLKHHAQALVKIVPVYLALLKSLLAWQWRQVQSASETRVLPIATSENLARLLEELGRPSHAKLFNKYLVGLLLDWVHIAKHKGASWGHAQQEAHQKAIHKGWFAIVNLCEEHDLAYLHNLLDPAGRAIFRTLHTAYKKTRFTGLV